MEETDINVCLEKIKTKRIPKKYCRAKKVLSYFLYIV